METHSKMAYSPDIATIISQELGISFLCDFDRRMELRGNVCFAHSPELRPEFRESFTLADLTGYLYGLIADTSKRKLYPPNAERFWELVKIGNESLSDFKKENSLRPITLGIYPILQYNKVTKIKLDGSGKLWISDMQYLTGIPPKVWEIRLYGEYPAKKWLVHHLGQELSAYEWDSYKRLLENLNTICNLMDKLSNQIDFDV